MDQKHHHQLEADSPPSGPDGTAALELAEDAAAMTAPNCCITEGFDRTLRTAALTAPAPVLATQVELESSEQIQCPGVAASPWVSPLLAIAGVLDTIRRERDAI